VTGRPGKIQVAVGAQAQGGQSRCQAIKSPMGPGAAKKRRNSEKPKPVKPITQGMEEGTEPMRAFSDLMQFYDKKKPDSQDQ